MNDATQSAFSPPPGFTPIDHSSFCSGIGPIFERRDADEVHRAFLAEEKHTNAGGVVHGGMLSTFADVLLGQAAWQAAQRPLVTVRLVSDFIAAVRPGDWVEGRSRVVRLGRTMVFVAGEVSVAGKVIMTISGNFKPIERKARKGKTSK
tara:strand:- start:119 stop:565 length:447 start_codon:yes stop_codon:yes gene_type:complete